MCRCCHSCSIDLASDLWEVLPGGGSPEWLFLSGHWDPLRSANTSQSINITLRSSLKYPLWSFIHPRFLKEVYTNPRHEWCMLSVSPEQNKMCNERIVLSVPCDKKMIVDSQFWVLFEINCNAGFEDFFVCRCSVLSSQNCSRCSLFQLSCAPIFYSVNHKIILDICTFFLHSLNVLWLHCNSMISEASHVVMECVLILRAGFSTSAPLECSCVNCEVTVHEWNVSRLKILCRCPSAPRLYL